MMASSVAADRQCLVFYSLRGKLVMTASRSVTSDLRLSGTGIGLKNSESQDTTQPYRYTWRPYSDPLTNTAILRSSFNVVTVNKSLRAFLCGVIILAMKVHGA
jgi:hypothetical protein